MIKLLVRWLVSTLAIMLTAYLLPGVTLTGIIPALAAAIVLGLINALLRPILIILTLPITVLTFGLFTLVINALLILLTSAIVPGFIVHGFWWAVLFSIVLFLINTFLNSLQY